MKSLLFAGVYILIAASQSFCQLKPGVKAPEFSLKDTSGRTLSLADLKGKYVLIDFWASWCGPCRQANKEMKKIYASLPSKDFVILSVSIDKDDHKWKKAIVDDKLPWIQVIDPNGFHAASAINYKVDAIPTTYLIDREGKIVMSDPYLGDVVKQLKKVLP